MIDLSPYKYFYFLGIGGIGMSALARYFISKGYEVAGYDRTQTELTDELEKDGIACHFDDNAEMIPQHFIQNKAGLLVIYTPAIPKDLLEFNYLLANDFKIIKRAEALASVTKGKQTIAVAGTHGKTSTASIISHILKTADVPFYAFLGGISVNYKTNFIVSAKKGDAELVVVEADEFDRSFLQLEPDTSIITAVESDHLDIYGSEENLRDAFNDFALKTKSGGTLIAHEDARISCPANVHGLSYGRSEGTDIRAIDIQIKDGKYWFDAILANEKLEGLSIGIPGIHNIENSLAAMSATRYLVNDRKVFYKALASFRGVHRRFEMIYNKNGIVFIDDYAHHPTEIRVTLQTIKNLYPGKKLVGIFQPHLFSRTRDLAKGFGESLSLLDELILMPIYPAREEPIPGVTSGLIFDETHAPVKKIVNKEDIIETLKVSDAEVIVTIGAGDIDRLVKPIKDWLQTKYGTN